MIIFREKGYHGRLFMTVILLDKLKVNARKQLANIQIWWKQLK